MGLKVRDIMQSDPAVVDPKMRLADLERAFLSHGVNGLPVVQQGRLVGVVSRSDLIRQLSVERSREGEISEYYRDLSRWGTEDARGSSRAEAAQVGIRFAEATVADVMSAAVVTASPEQDIHEVATILWERRIHRLPVVDAERLVGIITPLDLVRQVAESRLVPSGES